MNASDYQLLEKLVDERTIQLSEANDHLRQINEELAIEIAERKQAQEEAQQSSQKWEAIISVSPDGIGIVSLDGRIQHISDKLLIMHGYAVEEKQKYIGTTIFDFIDASSHKTLTENIHKLLSGKRDPKLTEYLAIRKDGSRFFINVNSTVLHDSNGNPASILYVERDITERKLAEADKEKMEARNRQRQKAESLGRMAGAIAHHFNNQLTVVIGNLDRALIELSQGANPRARIAEAMKASNRAAEMSGLMLTYLGQSFDRHEPLDLSEACRKSLPVFQAIVSGETVLETDLPSPGPVIMANANQIQQVLINLITNAREAVGEGPGTVRLSVKTVSVADIPAAHRFPLDWQPLNNAYACLEVADSGCGIEDQDIEKLFDPFFSSKFPGRGMGLAVVLGIVRGHGGVVTVESEPGRNSVFRVFFPISGETVIQE